MMSTDSKQDYTELVIRVIHLSTSHSGGAGIAARRLNSALISNGIESVFLALDTPSFLPGIGEIAKKRNTITRLVSSIYSSISNFTYRQTYFTLFSKSSLTISDIKALGSPRDSIVHIHNWFNLLNLRLLEAILIEGYKVVITLHDQRFFTGGCHYSLKCDGFRETCSSCPNLPPLMRQIPEWNLRRAEKLFQKFSSQITCISPSFWLKGKAEESSVLGQIPIFHIENIHESQKKGFEKNSHHNFERTTLGIANMDKFSKLKGYGNVLALERFLLTSDYPFVLAHLSDFQKQGRSHEDFWKHIDYLLVLSNADNSPNVIHEAKMYGIPVIGSRRGGIPELLNQDYDLCVEINSEMPKKILMFLNRERRLSHKELSEKIISDYEALSSGLIHKYVTIYKQLSY